MKKYILISLLSITTISEVKANDFYTPKKETPKIELNMDKVDLRLVPPTSSGGGYNETGVGLMVAGGAFTIGSLASSPEWYGYSGDNKKFFDNPARAAAVIGGAVMLSVGLVMTLTR